MLSGNITEYNITYVYVCRYHLQFQFKSRLNHQAHTLYIFILSHWPLHTLNLLTTTIIQGMITDHHIILLVKKTLFIHKYNYSPGVKQKQASSLEGTRKHERFHVFSPTLKKKNRYKYTNKRQLCRSFFDSRVVCSPSSSRGLIRVVSAQDLLQDSHYSHGLVVDPHGGNTRLGWLSVLSISQQHPSHPLCILIQSMLPTFDNSIP